MLALGDQFGNHLLLFLLGERFHLLLELLLLVVGHLTGQLVELFLEFLVVEGLSAGDFFLGPLFERLFLTG